MSFGFCAVSLVNPNLLNVTNRNDVRRMHDVCDGRQLTSKEDRSNENDSNDFTFQAQSNRQTKSLHRPLDCVARSPAKKAHKIPKRASLRRTKLSAKLARRAKLCAKLLPARN